MVGQKKTRKRRSMPGHAGLGFEEAYILATNVERHRKEQRITKQQLALMAGISRPTLNRIEAGHPTVRLEDICKLAGALGTTAADLLTVPNR